MNESISRSAGALYGQELTAEEITSLIIDAGYKPAQRSTLYQHLDYPELNETGVKQKPLVEGPSCEMLRACGHSSDVFGVLECYDGLIDALIIDIEDQDLTSRLARAGVDVSCQNTLMTDQESRCRVAEEMLGTLQSHFDLGGRKYAAR